MYPKRGPLHPRLFNEVLEAIYTLKEAKGSTENNIRDQVECILNKKIQNHSRQINRALKHGISNGFIKSKNGKYVLGMNQKDYSIFKAMQKLSSGGELGKQVRRKKSKKNRKRRPKRRTPKRRRRHSDLSETDEGDEEEDDGEEDDDDDDYDYDDDTCASSGRDSLEDRERRRGRKRKKRRGSRHIRKRDDILHSQEAVDINTENQKSKSSDDDSNKSENNGSDAGNIHKPASPNQAENNQDPVGSSNENQCENPDCL